MKIGVIVAMDGEYAQIVKLLGGEPEGRIGENEVVLRRSGIGKVNAAIGAAQLIENERRDCLISTGVAGGLSRELKALDMVAADEVAYHDVWCGEGNALGQVQGLPARFPCHRLLYSKALEMGAHGGLMCSGDWFVSTEAESSRILEGFPDGLACDMESGALAQVCFLKGTPFQSIRIISDVAGDDHQKHYDNFWKTVADDSFSNVSRYLRSLPTEI